MAEKNIRGVCLHISDMPVQKRPHFFLKRKIFLFLGCVQILVLPKNRDLPCEMGFWGPRTGGAQPPVFEILSYKKNVRLRWAQITFITQMRCS